MDDKKRKKMLWLAILLFIIMGVLFFVMMTSDRTVPEEMTEEEKNIAEQPVFEPKSAEVEEPEVAIPTETNTEFSVRALAMSYASRLGSWSTDNRGKNLQELLPLSTNSMKIYLNNRDLGEENVDYNGVTTKSLSAKIIYADDDTAEVLVKTQRIELDSNLNKNIYYQDISLSLVNIDDEWLVDEATWQ